jgi:hypothetical protein
MASSILQIILKVTKEGNGAKEAAREAKELKGTLSDLGLGSLASVTALGALTGAVTAVAAFTKKATDATLVYAMEVKNLKNITGESAEETSRVIQVMDDFEVTTTDLTAAQKKLSEQGLSLNIETLAKLSDEFNTLGSGAEKTRFLVDNFGKSGLKLASAMAAGGDAIREMSDATLESQVLNDEAIRQAEEYRLNLDALNDEWLGLQYTLGNAVIPAINESIKGWKAWTAALDEAEEQTGRTDQRSRILYAGIIARGQEAAAANDSAGQSYQAMAEKMAGAVPMVEDATDAIKAMSDANKEFYKGVQTFQAMEDSYLEKARTVTEERIALEAEKAAYIAQYGAENIEEIAKFDAALAENAVQAQMAADEHEKATRRIVLGYIEQKLAADGILTDDEINWLLEKGVQWGLYTDSVVEQTRRALEEANAYVDMLNSVPSQISTEFILNIVARGYDMQQLAYGYASGTDGWETVPAGYPNDSYPIFLTSGEKFAVIPAGGGAETYAGMTGQVAAAEGGEQVVTVKFAGDAERLFTPMVERIVKRMR